MSDAEFLGAASEPDEIATVRSFLAALESLDIDRVLDHVSPDITYHNVSLPPARGRDAFEKQMRGLARFATGFEAQIHHIASDGPVVLTERTDVIEAGPMRAAFWVCGTFEVRDGRVVLWRDYFDWLNVTTALLRGAGQAAVKALTRTTNNTIPDNSVG
jgi:limonene-1,2-epoxide hydrolase